MFFRMGRLFLCDCQPGDLVEDVFIVSGKQLSTTNTGKYFIKAFVSDRTTQVTARMWNATREIFNALPESGFIRVRGRVENYQNNLQFIIESLWPAKDGTYQIDDLMPHTDKNVEAMCKRLTEILQSIQNRHLAALIQAYLDDEALMANFCRAPAAMSFHHAFVGGLLEHTINAIEVAEGVVKFYPGLNRDLVIAGIFLHDIANTWELSYECAFGYTDGGYLIGHIVKSAMWVEHKSKIAEETLGEKIPQPLIDVVQHMILSHHDRPESGSPKVPATPEAIAVHMIENMDAKLTMALRATRGEQPTGIEGNWTEYMKAFGGKLYRPDVAPAVAVEAAEVPDAPSPAADVKSPASAAPRAATDGEPLAPAKLKITNPLFETTRARND
ncbi:HD domain-containing protein [soil metagenome]